MKIVKPSVEILFPTKEIANEMMKIIELSGRNCYKSEEKICEGSHEKMIGMLRARKHHSVLEHSMFTMRFIGSRAMSHQLVRHRISSISQESQRYCSYNKGKFNNEVVFVEPVGMKNWDLTAILNFTRGLESAEQFYFNALKNGLKAEDARGLLPNACKTEVVMTMNCRSLINFFELRCDSHAQAEIRLLAKSLLGQVNKFMPCIFKDLHEQFLGE